MPNRRAAGPAPALDVVTDTTATPGDVLRPLAALLLSLARQQLANQRIDLESHREQEDESRTDQGPTGSGREDSQKT